MIQEKLGNIVSFQRGYDLTHGQMHKGNIPVVGSSEIIGWHDIAKCEAPELLIGRSGTVGRPQYYDCAVWPHNTTLFVTNFHGNNPKYCYYLLQNLNLEDYANSSGVPTLNRNFIEPLQVEYHEKAEQSKIVDVLEAIDEKISTNNKIIETSEKLMREIYDYWFMQFDFPDENGRPYKSSGGEMVYDEKLKREIPKGWSVKRVDELCEVKTGKEDANFSVPDGDYKFFTCADEPLRCNTPCFSGKSILIAGNGNFNVKHYDGNFNAYQRTYVLQPGDEFYGITFIEAKNKTELFTKGSNGSIVKFITKGDVGGISVLTSPRAMELYETFNTILAEIDAVQSENEKLASLRDWLLPMLMNGQIKVSD